LQLQQWPDDWLLKFHPQKCSLLKLGAKKSNANYYMKSKDTNGDDCILQLSESEAEKDLGVAIDKKLSFKQHVAQAISKVDRIVGIISC
jgi:hypothetical protein